MASSRKRVRQPSLSAKAVNMAETITEACTKEVSSAIAVLANLQLDLACSMWQEKQLWSAMKALEPDCHADAIACRLHLSLAQPPPVDGAYDLWYIVHTAHKIVKTYMYIHIMYIYIYM